MRGAFFLVFLPIGVLLLAWALPGSAASWREQTQIHGFASQAALRTSANRVFGDSPATSFAFTELGLNLSLRPRPGLLLAGQALSRRVGELYDGSPTLDFLLADLTVRETPKYRFGMRLGRFKNPLGLYNETRDVPFTRPGIFLPQTIYFERVRNLMLANDGALLYGEWFGPAGNVTLNLGGGRAPLDDQVEAAFLTQDFPGTLNQAGLDWVGTLRYDSADERLRLGLSGVRLAMDFAPAATPATLDAGRVTTRYWIASARYDTEHWTLAAEYGRQPVSWRGFGPGLPDRKASIEGYYLQGAYRPWPRLELSLRYEEGYADRQDRDGRQLAAQFGATVPRSALFSKILVAGVRWHLDARWMLRAEYQRHDGTFILSERENPDPTRHRRDWELFALQLAVRF